MLVMGVGQKPLPLYILKEKNMNQFYIFEVQQYINGEFGHIVHFAYDANPTKARLKAEAKYH